MNDKTYSTIFLIGACLLGNYIGTVAMLAFSMQAWDDFALLVRLLRLNVSPWAEWKLSSAYGVVPLLLILSYVLARWRAPTKHVLTYISIVFGVLFMYVLVLDLILVAPLAHVTPPKFTMHVIFRALRLAVTSIFAVGLCEMIHVKVRSYVVMPQPKKVSSGFTLVEVLVVVAILMVLLGIVFAVVGPATSRSKSSVDIAQMKQVYMAVVMYEEDHGECPHSLLQASSYVSTKAIFKSPADDIPRIDKDYPADLYVFDSPLRAPFRVSYAYLRAFEGRRNWHERLDWTTFRSDPTVGILANKFYVPRANLRTDPKKAEHDYLRTWGTIYRIRMDGSLWVAKPHDGITVGGSINGLFVDP